LMVNRHFDNGNVCTFKMTHNVSGISAVAEVHVPSA
jgi:hypothetical protein